MARPRTQGHQPIRYLHNKFTGQLNTIISSLGTLRRRQVRRMVRRTLMAMRMVMAMRATTAMMAMTMSMTTMAMLVMKVEVTAMVILALRAAAGMEALPLSHVVGQGGQVAQEVVVDPLEDLEEEAHLRPRREDEVHCARRQGVIRCCPLIPWRRVVSACGIPTWSPGSLALVNVRSNCRIIRTTQLCASGRRFW